MFLRPTPVLAVSPLTTDDADPVTLGHFQLNDGWQFARIGSSLLHGPSINPVLGIHPRGELGFTFGYQWLTRHSSPTADDSFADLTFSSKWMLWQSKDDSFRISARVDLKVPTAPARPLLGTGHTDVGLVGIATKTWGPTSLDWNAGYTAANFGDLRLGDDRWFFGQAVRQDISSRWTLIGEVFLLLPRGHRGGTCTVNYYAGAQFLAHEGVLLSLMMGSATGVASPDLAGYLGITCDF